MKKVMIIFIAAVSALLALSGCREEGAKLSPQGEMFLMQSEYGIYKGDLPVMDFSRYESQMSINTLGTLFRLQTNDLSRVVECRLDRAPMGERKVVADVDFEGLNIESLEEADFRVVKEEPGKAWLWNQESGIGILMLTE